MHPGRVLTAEGHRRGSRQSWVGSSVSVCGDGLGHRGDGGDVGGENGVTCLGDTQTSWCLTEIASVVLVVQTSRLGYTRVGRHWRRDRRARETTHSRP